MNKFKSIAFSNIEDHIHAARLERSAALGEIIGNAFATAWHGAQRLGASLASNFAASKARMAARPLVGQGRVATPH